jgi:hypothetical protein
VVIKGLFPDPSRLPEELRSPYVFATVFSAIVLCFALVMRIAVFYWKTTHPLSHQWQSNAVDVLSNACALEASFRWYSAMTKAAIGGDSYFTVVPGTLGAISVLTVATTLAVLIPEVSTVSAQLKAMVVKGFSNILGANW